MAVRGWRRRRTRRRWPRRWGRRPPGRWWWNRHGHGHGHLGTGTGTGGGTGNADGGQDAGGHDGGAQDAGDSGSDSGTGTGMGTGIALHRHRNGNGHRTGTGRWHGHWHGRRNGRRHGNGHRHGDGRNGNRRRKFGCWPGFWRLRDSAVGVTLADDAGTTTVTGTGTGTGARAPGREPRTRMAGVDNWARRRWRRRSWRLRSARPSAGPWSALRGSEGRGPCRERWLRLRRRSPATFGRKLVDSRSLLCRVRLPVQAATSLAGSEEPPREEATMSTAHALFVIAGIAAASPAQADPHPRATVRRDPIACRAGDDLLPDRAEGTTVAVLDSAIDPSEGPGLRVQCRAGEPVGRLRAPRGRRQLRCVRRARPRGRHGPWDSGCGRDRGGRSRRARRLAQRVRARPCLRDTTRSGGIGCLRPGLGPRQRRPVPHRRRESLFRLAESPARTLRQRTRCRGDTSNARRGNRRRRLGGKRRQRRAGRPTGLRDRCHERRRGHGGRRCKR